MFDNISDDEHNHELIETLWNVNMEVMKEIMLTSG